MELNGKHGWIGLGVGVAVWDALAPETLSSAVDRALESRYRWLAVGTVAVTAAHLLNLLPEAVDPLHQLGKRMRINDGTPKTG